MSRMDQIGIIGNLENRRVQEFQTTAERLGLRPPICVSWLELLSDARSALKRLQGTAVVRIDSPGENEQVQHLLIRLGGGNQQLAFGEIGGLREQHTGFTALLGTVATLAVPFQNAPADIKVMFDKWLSHKRFVKAGISRPATFLAPPSLAQFRSCLASSPSLSGRLFVKPRFASSASGVCAYHWHRDRAQLFAAIEIERIGSKVRLFNTLRMRRYTSPHDIDTILERLLPQGMICERWIPKARLPDGQFDLRVLVVAGEARHVVVRQSRHPMTNLHLGNRRGDLSEVHALVGEPMISKARRLAEAGAACFPDSLYAGVDILIPAKGEPLVCEINAFGDLLPNVHHRGETTYEAILKASCNTERAQ